jgi:hypothetical protein
MADPNALLQKAQFAFQNVSPGSADSEKYTKKAKSLAHRIIRKYPDRHEANSARWILEQLGEQVPAVATRPAPVVHERVGTEERSRTTTSSDQFSAIINKYCLPGWAFRLMQTIPVLVGVNLLLPALLYFSFSRINGTSLLTLAAGGLLVSLPWLAVFDRLVAYVKTRIFSEQDWDSDVTHLPTKQDRDELMEAFLKGNTMKRILMVVALFVFSGYLLIFGAIVYVIGARKALDDIEGWLLDRKVLASAVAASAPVTAEKGSETTSETEGASTQEVRGDATDKLDDLEIGSHDSTAHDESDSAGFLKIGLVIVGFIILMAIVFILPFIVAILQILPFLIAIAPLLLVLGIIKP